MDEFIIKRFVVFGFSEYYPCGGFGDAVYSSDSEDEALAFALKCTYEYVSVFDLDARKFIYDKG